MASQSWRPNPAQTLTIGARNTCRGKGRVTQASRAGLELVSRRGAQLCGGPAASPYSAPSCPSPTGLKIVAVSCREKFIRIFNPSQESTADLSGMVLKQLVRGLPERLYRFPPGTLLAPRHHITVRPGPGARPRRPGRPSPAAPRPSRSGARGPAAPRSRRARPRAGSPSPSSPAAAARRCS